MKTLRTFLAVLLCTTAAFVYAQEKPLKFNKDGKFKIVQFTDTHWIAGDPRSDIAGERMNQILDEEKPDLVVYTGDIIFGGIAEDGMKKAQGKFMKRIIIAIIIFIIPFVLELLLDIANNVWDLGTDLCGIIF